MGENKRFSSLFVPLGDSPHELRPTLSIFTELDIAALRKELKPEDRGRALGADNEPPLDNTILDSAENEIIDRIETKKNQDRQAFVDQLDIFSERLAVLNFEGRIGDIDLGVKEAISRLGTIVETGLDHMHSLRRDFLQRERDLETFQRKNRLDRGVLYPTIGHKVLCWGILAVLFVIETVGNSYFLAKGNELGILGAYTEALAITAVNLGFPFLIAASFSRNFLHVHFGRKLFGLLSFFTFLAVATALNVGVAHYREVSGSLVAEGGAAVIARILVDPFGLAEFQSWVLFGLGIILSLLAFLDALKLDDIYPGYGAQARKLAEVRHFYIDRKTASIDDLTDELEEAVDALKQAKRELGRWRREHLSILEARKRLFEAFDIQLDHLERVVNMILSEYREANRRSRPDKKSPKRFGTAWQIDRPMIDRSPPETAMATQQLNDLINDSECRLEQGVDSLYAEFKEAMTKFSRLDHLVEPSSDRADTLPQK